MTTFEVSAQFGGRDAAQAFLPHFRALKSAVKGVSCSGFPFPQLAFILRVDGEVNTYGQSGVGNVEIDKKGRYVSVDIVITSADIAGRSVSEVAAFVAGAIVSSAEFLRRQEIARLERSDWEALETSLRAFSGVYEAEVRQIEG